MESKNFFKWFFRPNSASSSSSKDPAAMPTPHDKSPPAPQPPPDSDNAPPDPGHVAEDQLPAEVQQLCLKQPELVDQEAEGRVSRLREEDRKSEGEAEEKHDHGPDGYDDDDEEEEEEKEEEEEEEERDEDGNESDKEGDNKKERRDVGRKNKLPLRPETEDCAFYLKKGTCKFGSNCKFNHPIRRKPQVAKEKIKDKEESKEKTGQVECKYYLTPGGCKYGKACRYNHSKANSMAPVVELNFLGLPIRPGEKECPFYMRTGTCKFSANCKFNHPDPTSGADPPMEYGNGGSASLQNTSQFRVWSPSGTLNNDCPPYVPMLYPPAQVVPSPNAEWNGYQFPLNPQLQQSMHPPPAYIMNSPMTTDNHKYTNHQSLMGVEEFPERPGLPECSYFLKTGDCKFKSNCKYHHPKDRVPKSPQVALSDKGLPLRPDQNICSYYSRYGICKFGPACKFDHSVQLAPSGLERQPSMENSLGEDVPTMDRSRIADDPTVVQQQSV